MCPGHVRPFPVSTIFLHLNVSIVYMHIPFPCSCDKICNHIREVSNDSLKEFIYFLK